MVRFADIVATIRERFPEYGHVPIYIGTPFTKILGPCFVPYTGDELVLRLRQLYPDADQAYLSLFAHIPPAIHLPEEYPWMAGDELIASQFALVGQMIDRSGITHTDQSIAEFVVLHELGHYLDWWTTEDKVLWQSAVSIQLQQLHGLPLQLLPSVYRQLPHEARADRFALAKIRELYTTKRRRLSGIVQELFTSIFGGGE